MKSHPAIFQRVLLSIALLVLSATQPACSSLKIWCWGCGGDSGDDADAHLFHIVLLWQKLPGNPTHRKQLIETGLGFADIPGVESVRAGRAVLSDRAMVDDSFDVALVLAFKNKAALQLYLDHPKHQQAVTDALQPLVEKILVYDFIEPY